MEQTVFKKNEINPYNVSYNAAKAKHMPRTESIKDT